MSRFRDMAQNDPKRLVLMFEHGGIKGPDLEEACRWAGNYLDTELIQKPLIKMLANTKSPQEVNIILRALQNHVDDHLIKQLTYLSRNSPHQPVRMCCARFVEEESFDEDEDPTEAIEAIADELADD